jgi:hypothetical protein
MSINTCFSTRHRIPGESDLVLFFVKLQVYQFYFIIIVACSIDYRRGWNWMIRFINTLRNQLVFKSIQRYADLDLHTH